MVYVPTQGMMDKGLYRDVEPVAVVALSETDALRKAFADAITRGNPKVPLPKGSQIPPPILPQHAGVKTWGAFARGTTTWSISERDGVYRVQGYRNDGRGWVPDQDKKEPFASGTTAAQVIERMISILQEASQKRAGS